MSGIGSIGGNRAINGLNATAAATANRARTAGVANSSGASTASGTQGASNASGLNKQLTPQQQQQVADLKKRDSDVHQHEQAHLAAAGGYARGGANYTYTLGPDGKRYATGGEVSIDVSTESTPQATIAKMQTVERAALAPQDPSSQDRQVAAEAARAESEAQQELAKAPAQTAQSRQGGSNSTTAASQPQAAGAGASQSNAVLFAYSATTAQGKRLNVRA